MRKNILKRVRNVRRCDRASVRIGVRGLIYYYNYCILGIVRGGVSYRRADISVLGNAVGIEDLGVDSKLFKACNGVILLFRGTRLCGYSVSGNVSVLRASVTRNAFLKYS